MAASRRFTDELPHSEKKSRGRTEADETPLAIRSRIRLQPDVRDAIRAQFGRKLGQYALHIERISVRIDDVNGPKGGIDLVCRVKLVLSGLPSVVVEERGAKIVPLMTRAANVAERALRRELQRRERSSPGATRRAEAAPAPVKPPAAPDEGSLIGRRVGRSKANLERALARPEKLRGDAYVDTAAPGTSASDRKVGYGSTARRNTKRNQAGMTAALEDSRTTPSRKSTRKSANRMRSGTQLTNKASAESLAPKTQATRARAQARVRGKQPKI